MKKRLLSLLLSLSLLAASVPPAFAAEGYNNFTTIATYAQGQFTDVAADAWYAENVKTAYEIGLINGSSANAFTPSGSLTVGEAIKLSAVLHRIYTSGSAAFEASTPWYQTYVSYALQNGLITAGYANYDAAVTRAQFAVILAAALPDEALPVINDVEDGAIPDVSTASLYAASVYQLYRAGVLTGTDTAGSFRPSASIQRAEVAAIVTRMADQSLRRSVSLLRTASVELTSEQLFAQCSPAVFYIVVYDKAGSAIASGSGVFLSESGEAVTNYHVIEGASSAKIRTSEGKVYDVSGVYAYDADLDLARIQVKGSGFHSLPLGDSQNLTTGATVYAIGSPQGLENTLSNGIISSAHRTIEGMDYIQTTAAISHGSSGGALLNTKGELIGITSAYIEGGQNLNLAIPVRYLDELKTSSLVTLSAIVAESNKVTTTAATYAGFYPAPDFGAYAGVSAYQTDTAKGVTTYAYRASDIKGTANTVISGYLNLLTQNGFVFAGSQEQTGYSSLTYYQQSYTVMLTIGAGKAGVDEYVLISLSNT